MCTDASDHQLGAVIVQDDKPFAFCGGKLNSAQKNCATGEQELPSMVETVKEFRTLLWAQNLIVHTDHKNVICGNSSTDRITQWRSLLEEHSPAFLHVKGKDDIVADALSRLDKHSMPRDGDVETQGNSWHLHECLEAGPIPLCPGSNQCNKHGSVLCKEEGHGNGTIPHGPPGYR